MSASNHKLNDTTGIRVKPGACVVIVKTEWNPGIVDKLEEGCREELDKQGVHYTVLTVPGAFEISFAIRSYWDAHKYTDRKPAAFIALGCVVRGDTPHFDYVCRAVTDGILQLNLSIPVPSIFGVLTVDNEEQAKERVGGKHGHKGAESAITALKMISLLDEHCSRRPAENRKAS